MNTHQELDIETENALYPLTSGVDTFAKTNIKNNITSINGFANDRRKSRNSIAISQFIAQQSNC